MINTDNNILIQVERRDLNRIVVFLNAIYITCVARQFSLNELDNCFLAGIKIDRGTLFVDPDVANIGDLLHEAGHIAIFPRGWQHLLNNETIADVEKMIDRLANENIEISQQQSEDLMYCYDDLAPQGWSYAIAILLGIDPLECFSKGYEGKGQDICYGMGLSIGKMMGCLQSVSLYYLGFMKSKASFPTLTKFRN